MIFAARSLMYCCRYSTSKNVLRMTSFTVDRISLNFAGMTPEPICER
jgi:hypothetical protein